MNKAAKVVVLTIGHRHGTNTYVAESPKLAKGLLHAYARQWWGDGNNLPDKCPDNADKAIDLYFSERGREDESYEISDPQEITTADNLKRHMRGV